MEFKENKLVGGGGSLKPSHNQDFSLIEAFNNLALWGEKKFVGELKRTYKFQRGVYCHTEDNSPKYRMVGKIYQCLTNVDKRLHNKCAMTCVEENILSLGGESGCLNEVNYNHERGLKHELINNEPSPDFLSSSQLTKKFNHRTEREGNRTSVGNMKENNSTYKVYSLFTTHYSLIHTDTDFSRFSSHFSLKSAFTLAEVLITLGIIGVVAAMTIPTLIGNYKFSVLNNQLKTVYSDLNQAATLFKVHNEISVSEYAASTSATSALDLFSKEYTTVLNRNNMDAGTKDENGYRLEPYETHSITGKGSGALFCDASYYMYDPQGRIISFDNKPSGYENGPKVCIDVNGLKKPNSLGQDIFIFVFTVDGHVIPFGQQHANNPAVGWIYGNGSIENKEDYCVYSSDSSKQIACANYALINQHPHTDGKDYWHDFVNGK